MTGPRDPVAARAGVGYSSQDAWCLEVQPDSGEVTADLPLTAPIEVADGDELRFVVFPESAAEGQRRWDSTYVCLDAVLDDGRRLSGMGLVDQYGQALTPEAQGDGKRAWVDQWNLRRVALTGLGGRRIERILVVARAGEVPLRVWGDEVDVRPARPFPARALDQVDIRRGTHSSDRFSRGNNAPLIGLPHGGVFGLPMTDAAVSGWPYAWQAHNRETAGGPNRPTIEAFATSHIPSPWMGDHGVFQVMPSPLAEPVEGRRERALGFDHDDEEPGPHRYAVTLDGDLTAELVPGDFALGMRFTGARSLVLDHHGEIRSLTCSHDSEGLVVRALLDDREGKPAQHVHLRVDGTSQLRLGEGRLRGHIALSGAGEVDVRLGVSTVSDEQAAANLADAGSFDEMAARARAEWERALATVEVEGASDDQLVSIRSGLYRLFLYPGRFGEGPSHTHVSPYDLTTVRHAPMTVTHGFWDTYRTAWPLLALLDPAGAGELAEGFVEHFRDRGWTPRWSAPAAEDCMTGTTFDTVLGDLALRDVPGIDLETAYASALRNATVPPDDTRVGRKGLRKAIFRGHVDTETHEGLSWTLDNAINDWGISRLAHTLGQNRADEDLAAEEEYFSRRALGYRNVFDPDRGFFIGRTPSGAWRDRFDPDEWGHDYTETNAWGTAFTAPHDGAGLAELHGGEAALGAKLDEFFSRPETGAASLSGHYGFAIHEMTEARDVRLGMLGLSNQPAHHIPFMYMFAGRHDDAHRIVRECVSRLFVGSDLGQGYPGDEDNGEMSAWYVLASIGLYPLVPGSASYVVVPPSVRRTVLRPVGGKEIVIETDGEGDYIRAVTLDGEPWEEISIPHARLAAGAHLVIELSEVPCGWAKGSRPPSASRVTPGLPVADVTVTVPGTLTDDTGETAVILGPGEQVEVPLAGERRLSLYTVTAACDGRIGWEVDYLDATGATVAREERAGETYVWAGQTRVFRVRRGEPVTASAVRFTAVTACVLTQLEVIEDDRDNRVRQDEH
ncbi:putative alpha-1,2-mannosidase [Nocardioides albertanoniae]|uniref:Putative alpha-1,2-mannosidase n=1 Tax=Nocardioides albertanoniae TaxID=1175486 RepID=A0A543A5E2_9ACTN|nr:GH92 family glycosyl hydrolase [Nocardioides albertanoniae]TQL67821.1 putative alpha-1,2-mannosidase [Nocardioides albertanoniae]